MRSQCTRMPVHPLSWDHVALLHGVQGHFCVFIPQTISGQSVSSHFMMLQGDMIPWTISQQYQDTEFPRLSGARVVRIAAHPDMTRAGYGTRALELLRRYYEGDLADLVILLAYT